MSKHDARSPYNVVKHFLITEKSSLLKELGGSKNFKVVFIVDINANKSEISKAVETIYGVGVKKVNLMVKKPRVVMRRKRVGKTSKVKKAIVTLVEGDVIEDMEV